jgi:hypothetical protein
MKFLDTVAGRGVFFLFVGALCVASFEDSIGLEGLLGIFTGLAVFVIAVVNVLVGFNANAVFQQLRDKITSEQLEKNFKEADVDNSGCLDLAELAVFCKAMGLELNHRQWELLVQEMDADGNGLIDWKEFKRWWSRASL